MAKECDSKTCDKSSCEGCASKKNPQSMQAAMSLRRSFLIMSVPPGSSLRCGWP